MRFISLLSSAFMISLVSVGIALFFIRDRLIPEPLGHEVSIHAQRSSASIITNEFLIQVHPSHVKELATLLESLSLKIKFPLLNWILIDGIAENSEIVPLTSDKASLSRLRLNSLLQSPIILDAQHNFVMEASALPEQWFKKEWQLENKNFAMPYAMNMAKAWAITKGSSDVSVAIVDQFSADGRLVFDDVQACSSRVKFLQPLMRKPTHGPSHMPHGELMLQALGACNGARPYSLGVDWHAQLIAVDRSDIGHAATFIAVLAASGIDVCRESIVPCPNADAVQTQARAPDILLLPFGNDAPDLLQFSADMLTAVTNKGVIVVTAAGNEGSDARNFFPGGSPNVINVGAINKKGERAEFSNWGPLVDLYAPGDDVEMSYPNGPKNVSGTSLAAAYAAGALLLMKSVNHALTAEEAEYSLQKSATPLSCERYCGDDNASNHDACIEVCCKDNSPCPLLTLDIEKAVLEAKHPETLPPLLKLDYRYALYLRDQAEPEEIKIANVGGTPAEITINIADDNFIVQPQTFTLNRRGSPRSEQIIKISFKREPYKRQTYRFDIDAAVDNSVVEREEFYLEYIPKR